MLDEEQLDKLYQFGMKNGSWEAQHAVYVIKDLEDEIRRVNEMCQKQIDDVVINSIFQWLESALGFKWYCYSSDPDGETEIRVASSKMRAIELLNNEECDTVYFGRELFPLEYNLGGTLASRRIEKQEL